MIATEENSKETKAQKRLKNVQKEEQIDDKTGEIIEDFLDEKIPVTSNREALQEKEGQGIFFKDEIATFAFSFGKMSVAEKKDSTERALEIKIISHLPEFKTGYWFIMTFDAEPYEKRIISELKNKADYEANNQMELFNTTKEKELQKFDERIVEIKKNRDEMSAQCPQIKFFGSVNNIDTSNTFPVFTLQIMEKTVNLLNSSWSLIRNYKIQLQ